MEKERERAEEMGYADPIQPNKASTDQDYDLALTYCIENGVYLVSGSHNENSNLWLTELMEKHEIHPDSDRVFFSQLYGDTNVENTPANAGRLMILKTPSASNSFFSWSRYCGAQRQLTSQHAATLMIK